MNGSVLVLVTRQDEVDALVSLAAHFADAYQLQLQIMCWGFAPGLADAAIEDTLSSPEADALLQSTRRFIDKSATTDVLAAKDINIFRSHRSRPGGCRAHLEQRTRSATVDGCRYGAQRFTCKRCRRGPQ